MIRFGYTLSSEEHGPRALVRNAARAEELGFDFLSISDHFHPWVDRQGHSPFVWAVLGALAEATERIPIGTGVTCPIQRIHPAVLAHATATVAQLLPGRFFFGVGTGEALNEHVTGEKWPVATVRLEMLEEAVEVIRGLWAGELFSHRGTHFTVENARIYDAPEQLPDVVVSGAGPKATSVAARIGDGYWGMGPQAELVEQYAREGGRGHRYAQVTLCWGPDVDKARATAFEIWPNTGLTGQLAQELALPAYFESAAELLTPEKALEHVPCGPDAGPVLDAVQAFLDAGFDSVYLHQIGPDQEGFLDWAAAEVLPELRARGAG